MSYKRRSHYRVLNWIKRKDIKTMSDWRTKQKYVNEFLTVCKFIGLVLVLTVIVRFL